LLLFKVGLIRRVVVFSTCSAWVGQSRSCCRRRHSRRGSVVVNIRHCGIISFSVAVAVEEGARLFFPRGPLKNHCKKQTKKEARISAAASRTQGQLRNKCEETQGTGIQQFQHRH